MCASGDCVMSKVHINFIGQPSSKLGLGCRCCESFVWYYSFFFLERNICVHVKYMTSVKKYHGSFYATTLIIQPRRNVKTFSKGSWKKEPFWYDSLNQKDFINWGFSYKYKLKQLNQFGWILIRVRIFLTAESWQSSSGSFIYKD